MNLLDLEEFGTSGVALAQNASAQVAQVPRQAAAVILCSNVAATAKFGDQPAVANDPNGIPLVAGSAILIPVGLGEVQLLQAITAAAGGGLVSAVFLRKRVLTSLDSAAM